MNNNSRTKNSVRNFIVTTGCQFFSLIMGFLVRTFFINRLGVTYLGVNGLFTNILTVLSLAELGVGSAIGFSLYKPVAENDKDKISALMYFYRKAYIVIAGSVAVIGLALIPFLDKLITTDTEIDKLVLYYVLFLANSVVSYLWAYKSTLLFVDQKNYVTRICHTVISLLQSVSQFLILYLTGNFTFYLIAQIFFTVLNNVIVSVIVDRDYAFIRKNKARLDREEQKTIFENVKAMFVYKIGGVLVNNTDNILISKLINIASVGFYSNYTLVINSVTNILSLVAGSVTGSVGNYNALESKENSQKLFEAISLLDYLLYGFTSVGLFCLLEDFVTIWLSTSKYSLDKATLVAVVLSTFIMGISTSTSTFRSTTGLFKETKYIFLFTAVLNILLSIILGLKIGLCGIIFATSISKLLTNFWYEPYMLYKKCFEQSCVMHFLKKLKIFLICVFCCVLIRWIFSLITLPLTSVTLMLEGIITVTVTSVVLFLAYFRTEEFRFIAGKLIPPARAKIKAILKK